MFSGCATVYTMSNPAVSCKCPESRVEPRFVYSGLRCDIETMPSCNILNLAPFDMPFSFVGDTIVLPIRLVQAAVYPSHREAYKTSGSARITSTPTYPVSTATSTYPASGVIAEILDGTWIGADHVACNAVSGGHGSFSTVAHVFLPSHERRLVNLSPISALIHAQLRIGDVISCRSD